ncbi:thermonuclease family protein [Mycobacterium paragordonae]|uniref:Thermonuclease family protein n=1 Tax=Mycobacterium paragordonae TaxID=1389713 RepID=A0AAJ1W8Y4_9MYCO|nr:thermonuclease family protein [Mycobacterium paragordonae]MDP7739309.1 thermonuclease family protein [Mycobacterium paragordonae]
MAGRTETSPLGTATAAFASETLLGQRVTLTPDPTQDRTDRYGRTLAYLTKADGWDYSTEAARAGAACSYVYRGHPAARGRRHSRGRSGSQSCPTLRVHLAVDMCRYRRYEWGSASGRARLNSGRNRKAVRAR